MKDNSDFVLGVTQGTATKAQLWITTCLVGCGIGVAYWLLFGGLPVLTEARDFIYFGGWTGQASLKEFFLFPEGANRRLSSMFVFAVERKLCGVDDQCVNVFQFGLMGLCGTLLVLHGYQVTKNVVISAFGALLWGFSAAAANAGIWQATQHDKIALLMSTLVLMWGYNAVVRVKTGKMWPSATVGTFLCVLALNAKEISFFLPGALLLQAILFSRDRSPSGYWHSIARVAAPVMYSAWFIIYYMSHLEGGWENHVVGGNTKVAVGHSLMFLMNIGNVMNLGNWSPWVHVVKAIVTAGVLMAFALSVYLLVVRRREGAAARTSDGGLRERLYLAGIFVMTMAIVARTTHPSAYYLLIPAWSFYLIITIMMWKTGEALNVRWGKTITVTVGVLIFQIGFLGNFAPGAAFRRIMDQGRNLSESYAEIRVALGEQSPEQVRFILPKTVDGYWYFFRGLNRDDMAADRYITPFMLRKNMLVPVAYEFGSATKPAVPGELVVWWKSDLKILKMKFDRDSHEIVQPARIGYDQAKLKERHF